MELLRREQILVVYKAFMLHGIFKQIIVLTLLFSSSRITKSREWKSLLTYSNNKNIRFLKFLIRQNHLPNSMPLHFYISDFLSWGHPPSLLWVSAQSLVSQNPSNSASKHFCFWGYDLSNSMNELPRNPPLLKLATINLQNWYIMNSDMILAP